MSLLRTAALRIAPRQIIRPVVMEAGRVRQYTEGATGSGASRATGSAGGDSFTKREKANEDYYIRKAEKERLRLFRAKLAEQKKHIAELEQHLDELSKEQGGEQN